MIKADLTSNNHYGYNYFNLFDPIVPEHKSLTLSDYGLILKYQMQS